MRGLTVMAAGFIAVTAGSAPADVIFRFAVAQVNYDLLPGSTLDVPVYLEETVTGTSVSLLGAEAGLFSAGVRVAQSGDIPSDPAHFMGPASVTPNTVDFTDASDPLFGPVVTVPTDGGEASLLEFARGSGVTGVQSGPGVRRVMLGRFTVTAGRILGQGTAFQVTDYDTSTSDTVTWAHQIVLDSMAFGIASASFTVTSGCRANFNGDMVINVQDFLAYISAYAAGDPRVDFNGDGRITVDDFLTFLVEFARCSL